MSLLPLVLILGMTADAAELPNVVVILADDLGYGDVGALNPDSTLPTPALDRLAREGMTFRDAHSPSAVCTPTRYGLLTGRYCWRSRMKSGVLNGYGKPLLEPGRPTVGDLLRGAGYRTSCVGKWHLGLGFSRPDGDDGDIDFAAPIDDGPTHHGFDEFFGIPASLDFPPYVYIDGDTVTEPTIRRQEALRFPEFMRAGERAADFDPVDSLDRLIRAAIEFVERESRTDRPFFLYLALSAPHKPVMPHPRFRRATDLGPYGDFIVQTDAAVGAVLDALDRFGVADDTLVVATSDNGSFMYRRDDPSQVDHVDDHGVQAYRADRHRSNHHFRGTKADIYEAGHRVPFFVRWPGRVAAGSASDVPVCHVDLYSTFAEIIGRDVVDGAAEDSHSLMPMLRHDASAARPPVIHHSGSGMFAIRAGRYKLILGNGSGGRAKPKGKPFERPYQLFDLENDPSEAHDLASAQPDVVERLIVTFEGIHGE